MSQEVQKLLNEIEALKKDRDHWKANHDNAVAIKKAVLDRPDLKDRAATVLRLRAALRLAYMLLQKVVEGNLAWRKAPEGQRG